MGSPIDHKSFVQDVCFKQVDSAKVFLSKLPGLNDAQTASLLLRYCGIPKISHLLRCIPPLVIDTAATEFDCTIINTFEAIIGCKLSVQEIRQLSLPISQGGFSLTKSSSTASVAFLGAWASSLHHLPLRDQRMIAICDHISLHSARDCSVNNSSSIGIHLDKTLLEVHSSCETTKQLILSLKDLPNHPRKLQSHLNSKLKDNNFHQFLRDCQSKKDMARVISCGEPTAGCWLDTMPSSQDYTLSNAEFCMASLLRLGGSLPALRARQLYCTVRRAN